MNQPREIDFSKININTPNRNKKKALIKRMQVKINMQEEEDDKLDMVAE
jgi:hypothetical protein